MQKYRVLVFILLITLSVTACAEGGKTPLEQTHIRLPMAYIPNVQFAPFYVAYDKGYFEEVGIDLEFDYSFETDGVAMVGANDLQFAIVSGEQVPIARAEGIPIVYVMAWYKDYPVAIVIDKTLGIESPQDLAGRTVGLPGLFGANYVGLRAFLQVNGLEESDLTLDSIGFNQVELFASGKEDVVVGYIANEPVQLRSRGYDLTVFAISDYVDLVSNGLITNQTTLEENPELVRAMIQATLRGIKYTVENPDEAYEISKKYVEGLADADEEIQKEVLAASISLYQTDPYGYSIASAWENMQDVLLNMGLMKEAIDLDAAYTNEFTN